MAANRSLERLRSARDDRHSELLALPNVIGTGLGIKRRGGVVVARAALLIFVAKKIELECLPRALRIPKSVECRGNRIPTDVVQITGVRREFGPAPYALSDSATKGMLSAFAQGENGSAYGISCAHCLEGSDEDPFTETRIGIWDSAIQSYVEVGQSGFAVDSPGFGLPGDFGFLDAGLIALEHPVLIQRARAAPQLAVLTNPRRGMRVFAETFGAAVSGTVDAMETIVDGLHVDLVIRVDGRGTYPGFSGMLWRATSGQAVGIHAYGANFEGEDGGSRLSLAMAARRVTYQLQVRLRDPGWN
jgi:hypothetical protein